MKIKPRGRVQVDHDDNIELTVENYVFPLDELVNPYRVAQSNNLEENSIFHIVENTFVDVDVDVEVEELHDILKISEYTQVNEDGDICNILKL